MSVSETVHRPENRGRAVKLWLAFLILIAAGVGLAWAGTRSFRAETTANGVQIRTVEKGAGPLVQSVDGVMIEYEGRLTDGTVFDASQGRPVPMLAGQVIPGFSEALQKMQKGGRYKIRIPAKLAYGASPPPGSPIPANADLDFDVHVVEVVPNAALMMGSGAPGGASGGASAESAIPGEAAPGEGSPEPQPQPQQPAQQP